MTGALPPVIRLSAEVARQFAHLPARSAAEAIASHLTRFWESGMLTELAERVAANEPEIDPLVAVATREIIAPQRDRQARQPAGG